MSPIGVSSIRITARFALALLCAVPWTTANAAEPNGFKRTEAREPCQNSSKWRQPFFGETHLHTGLSMDASLRFVQPGPRDAYRFAKGAPIVGADPTGLPTRTYQIDRPIDWGAVTDHSELFGEIGVCKSADLPGRFSLECNILNGFYWQPSVLPIPAFQRSFASAGFNLIVMPSTGPSSKNSRTPICVSGQAPCDATELAVWEEMQAAAEEAYDRTRNCSFTSFVGYENTSTPLSVNWHRNVIFRNHVVIPKPITAIDIAREPNPDPNVDAPEWVVPGGPDVAKLWDGLRTQCRDAGTGCDVLTIPHNPNLGPGIGPIPPLFFDPADAEQAAKRQAFEPLVEIYQDKGSSECRWDPRVQAGTDTNDELCNFELLESSSILDASGVGAGTGGGVIDPRSFDPRTQVRNVLKAGVKFEQEIGVNPFKLGIIAATDSHNATMGWNPENATFGGHLGIEDAIPVRTSAGIQNSSGGLAVAWAEENSRDAIFEALLRRETYGTSGIRPIVRFFGGWAFDKENRSPNLLCGPDGLGGPGFVQRGYLNGVPMGGDLPARRENELAESPDFILAARFDDFIGTPLQQIQIIKGWVDSEGQTHEATYTVAGNPDNGATVDEQCNPVGGGSEALCAVWTDPAFDPTQHAFYYARVIENPVCRYSTLYCQQNFGVNPLLPGEQCQAQIAAITDPVASGNAQLCCANETTVPRVQPVIQERAWTSPIWYRP